MKFSKMMELVFKIPFNEMSEDKNAIRNGGRFLAELIIKDSGLNKQRRLLYRELATEYVELAKKHGLTDMGRLERAIA